MPITRQIVDQLRMQCAGGQLRPGDRLPSVRELARDLAINQNTVLRVYERLTAEGLLERRHGDGTYVADQLPAGQLRTQRNALRGELRRWIQQARASGLSADELQAMFDEALGDRNTSRSAKTKGQS